jgi:hypothetical protein
MDFMPANGDVLSGTFTNIGRFIINAGDTIYAGSSNLTLFTNEALINGTLYGGATLSPSLNLTSEGNLTLTSTGILDQWTSIYLASGSGIMTLNGAINTLNSGSTSLPPEQIVISPGGAVFIDGGGLTLTPVPLPPAVLLFGSGLLAMGLARRRLKVWDEVEAELVQFIKGAPTAMTRPATSRQTGRKISLTEL